MSGSSLVPTIPAAYRSETCSRTEIPLSRLGAGRGDRTENYAPTGRGAGETGG